MKHVLAVCVMVIISACAGAPVQEMSDARQAVRAAQAAGAEDRAPAELAQARKLIAEAQQQLQNHDYSRAKDTAIEARKQAISALDIARESVAGER